MQNQHRINYQTSYFGNTVLYVVESVGSIADNVTWLCAVGDFGNGTFNLPQTLIRSRNLNKPPQPLLHKTRVISWLRIINDKLKLK